MIYNISEIKTIQEVKPNSGEQIAHGMVISVYSDLQELLNAVNSENWEDISLDLQRLKTDMGRLESFVESEEPSAFTKQAKGLCNSLNDAINTYFLSKSENYYKQNAATVGYNINSVENVYIATFEKSIHEYQ